MLLVLTTLLVLGMGFSFYLNIKPALTVTDAGYEKGTVVNLTDKTTEAQLQKVFVNGDYFTDKIYAQFVTKQIVEDLKKVKKIKNLGSLNKKDFFVDAANFEKVNAQTARLRFINSLAHLGMDSAMYIQEQKNPVHYPAEVSVSNVPSKLSIKGDVSFKNNSADGVLIQLSRLFADNDTSLAKMDESTDVFYARTDKDGHFEFNNIVYGANYSILPIKPGFEFGASKGSATIKEDKTFSFTGKPHQLRVLETVEYRQIKADKVLTVRTPTDFVNNLFKHIVLFIVSFWLLHFVMRLKKLRSDQFILPLLMFLTGVSIMVLYSIQDPLRDEVFSDAMVYCVSGVLLATSVVILFFKPSDINKFYHSTIFDPLHRLLPFTDKRKEPRGYTWLIAAIGCMIALAFLGTGPEGSGVKVNLFGFQVSEVAKFLMIVFFATYFTVNLRYFRNISDNRWLTKNNATMLLLFGFLILLYAYLGDLGPAVVLCLTFLFFYSFAKKEFLQMILAVTIYVCILLIAAKWFNDGDAENVLFYIALVAVVSSASFVIIRKKYETIFFVILIISAFILLGKLPFSFTKRLADRNDMFSNIWENSLIGGDQIAHGVWSLNSGGWLGAGLGNGHSNVMPAYHTDMIIQSIGEELGLIALIAIFIAVGLLAYRCILAARRTGNTFLFYLCSGIAIATVLQFIIIVSGTLGLIPLTGISVPFLSKGNAGIIVTLFSFMMILFISHEKGNKEDMEHIKENFDTVNAAAILTFFGAVVVFIGTLFWYQYKSNEYIVQPAMVMNKQGSWQFTYNPRIGIMLKEIQPGNIYDKNGVLLATSDRSQLTKQRNTILGNGVSTERLNQLMNQDIKRYYPLGEKTIFWLGDLNREIAREEHSGYAAEYRHFTMLRGFKVENTTVQKSTSRYRENKFLPASSREIELVKYDYSDLAPFLKTSKFSPLIDSILRKKKDIKLSVDVRLSEAMFNALKNVSEIQKFRTSLVAVQPSTGDVLASVSNPMPSFNDLKLISTIDPLEYKAIYKQIFNPDLIIPQDLGVTYASRPGSTIKILDASAAYNQYGMSASDISFFVEPGEIIRAGEPSNVQVNMHDAIVHSSNVYFIKLANEKNLQASLFNMYDQVGMNILNRGGYYFQKSENYNSEKFFQVWDKYVSVGKDIYNNKTLKGTRRRFFSRYSDIAWGQGELKSTPLQLARVTASIANNGIYNPSKFLVQTWTEASLKKESIQLIKDKNAANVLGSFMKDQSAKISAATGVTVYGKTGSPERDKWIKKGDKTIKKRVTDAWYTFYVHSSRYNEPLAFTIRIEEIGNSEHALNLAKELIQQLKSAGII
ncbi:MAG: cell cycle protein [Bacteroidia bacterium]|nr:MAG: cell cycle protein [Bacteroidia bacterium]